MMSKFEVVPLLVIRHGAVLDCSAERSNKALIATRHFGFFFNFVHALL